MKTLNEEIIDQSYDWIYYNGRSKASSEGFRDGLVGDYYPYQYPSEWVYDPISGEWDTSNVSEYEVGVYYGYEAGYWAASYALEDIRYYLFDSTLSKDSVLSQIDSTLIRDNIIIPYWENY